ncbi:unnamed protein product [Symbiodinium sp. CCMP2456]|nr:unnamed protein product [Symbiodinium sp. CCMP2456]
MGSLFERLWPDAHWWLRVCHLEHLVEFSFLRLMLFIGSVISGVFGVTWLLDVVELRCFENKPWTQEGAGKYTCSVKFLGGLMMLMMFWQSVMALIHFDKNLDRLKQDRKQCIDDMNSQIGVALTHATSQAKRLCELLEIQLVQQVRGHIHKMRNILQKCEQFCPEEFNNLVELMANHLHRLRKPAMKKFEKLVLAFNQEAVFYDLTQTLRQQKQTSMVKLLTIQSEHARSLQLPRTKTAHDPEAARPLLDQDQQLAQGLQSWCSSVYRGYRKKRRTSKTSFTSNLAQVAFSHDDKLKELLREPTEDDMKSKPEAVLLRPVSLVLNFFEKIQPFVHGEPLHAEDEEVTIGTPSQEENPYMKQANKVYVHLTDSPLYVSVLVGVVCSVALLLFHFHMAVVVLHVIRTGDHCASLGMWSCSMELVRVITVMTGMLCHTVSLLVILWNVDKLDQVLELTEDIKEFKKTKDQIESLNKNDLADKDLDMKTLEDAQTCLQGQSGIVEEFFLRHTGQQLDAGDFRSFMEELRDALPCDEKPCSVTTSRGGAEYTVYTAVPSEESETGKCVLVFGYRGALAKQVSCGPAKVQASRTNGRDYSGLKLSVAECKSLLQRRDIQIPHVTEKSDLLHALHETNPHVPGAQSGMARIPSKWKRCYVYAELDSKRQHIAEAEVAHFRWRLVYHGRPSSMGLRHFQKNGVFVSPHFGETRWSLLHGGRFFEMQGIDPLQVSRNSDNWGWVIGAETSTEYHSAEFEQDL